MLDNQNQILADVATRPPDKSLEFSLDQVGLENVQTQVRFQGLLLPALAQASVSLNNKNARGIHMSRLFKILTSLPEQELAWTMLNDVIEQMLSTHQGLSDSAFLRVNFELPVLRNALISDSKGWRNYPLTYLISQSGKDRKMQFEAKVLYSSTCPCSAALSRQTMQEDFSLNFKEEMVNKSNVLEWLGQSAAAVPHAQRSEAKVLFTLNPEVAFPSPVSLIDEMENALGTPVQAAVKRVDEQHFAKLNSSNLMFCEDAARKLKAALLKRAELADFHIEVRHFESLHPHDVVAKVSKYSEVD